MPKRNVQFMKGHYYHIYNRGARRLSIMRKEKNYLYLLGLMKKNAVECAATFIAYCSLPNHYHWLVRQDGEQEAGKLPTKVFGSYSQAFNRAYQHSGTLFEGPYKVLPVTTDEYLRHLCCYIHANPVRHGIAMSPELWPYSNYLEWIGQRAGTIVDPHFVATRFPLANYQRYVQSYLTGQAQLPVGLKHYLESL